MKSNYEKKSTDKSKIVKAVKLALASSLLVSGVSHAVLRDHGPSNPVVGFPDWYRDFNGLVLGQCVKGDESQNGPLCLTGPADALPPTEAFPGNIGEEAFYAAADIEIPINGGSFQWLGHLEMAYGSATGAPPAVRNANTPATEIVFSRERMRFDIPATDGSCSGEYTIRTPYGVHHFDLEEGARALFYTDDIQPINGNYSAALDGHAGPFLTWNVGADGLNPVSAENPVVTITPPSGPARKYIGDPNIPHTFVGSTLDAGEGHLDKGKNNYVEITPPSGCNLGAGPSTPLFNDEASISGLIWDLPIADPVSISKATYTRDASSASLDVWASATKNHNLVLTAIDNSTQHVPSVTMDEEIKNGVSQGFYHAHIEFDPNQTLPSQVSVADLNSNPVARDPAAVVDEVIISKATFNTSTRVLCIAAHSGDEVSPVPLRLDAPIFGSNGSFGSPTGSCPAVASNDRVLEIDLDDLNPDIRIPPEGVLVKSERGGQETVQPSVINTGILDALNDRAKDDKFTGVPGSGSKTIDLVSGPYTDGTLVKEDGGLDTVPTNPYRIVVISQPEKGTVTAAANGGVVTYTAEEAMPSSTQTFYYAIQDTSNNSVSNVAKVVMDVVEVVPPPVGVPDRQGVFRTSAGTTISVLANDTTGLGSFAIDPTTIQLSGGSNTFNTGRANVTANANGTITYVPVNQGGTANNTIDTFTYTVANVRGARSLAITVQVALKSAAEAVAFQRARFNNGWDIRFTSSYAGAAGTIVLAPTATCALTANPGAPTRIGPIGGVTNPVAGANNYVVLGATPVPSGNNWTVRCTTSSGGAQNRTGTL